MHPSWRLPLIRTYFGSTSFKLYIMKTLHCSDAGFDCKGVIQASTEDEVLTQAVQHAREVHGVAVTPEMAARLRTLIKEEEVPVAR